MCNLCQAIPGVNFVDIPDVILPSVDGEEASVGVIELKNNTDWCHLFSQCVSCLSVVNKYKKGPLRYWESLRKQGQLAESLFFYWQWLKDIISSCPVWTP